MPRKHRVYVPDGIYHVILMHLVRCIHLNPVTAGMVLAAARYLWSSHRAYLGLGDGPIKL